MHVHGNDSGQLLSEWFCVARLSCPESSSCAIVSTVLPAPLPVSKLSGRGIIFYFSLFFQLGEQPVCFGVLSRGISHIFACTDKENGLFLLVKEFGQLVSACFKWAGS